MTATTSSRFTAPPNNPWTNAAPAAVLFWLIVRRGAPFRGPGLGAAVAGLSVFLALTVVQSQCMFQQAPHILVWHAGIAALLIICGALAGLKL